MTAATTMLKRPGAWVPLVMSAAATAVLLSYLAVHGPAPQADEGAAAHTWQLLMAGQVPLMMLFAFRWLPEAPGPAVRVLLVQVAAFVAAAAPVFIMGW